MAVEILESVKDDEVEEEQELITGTIAPAPVTLTGDTAPDHYDFASPIKVGEPDEPGFFSRAFDSFDEWRDKKRAQVTPISREEARELTKENVKRNREIMGNKGYGPFSFGNARAPSHSSLVRAGLEEPPKEEGEAALLPYLRDNPLQESRPKRPGAEQTRTAKEQAKWKTYPKDPAGFLIDPTRPILMNEDGSSSSERTVTIEGDGQFFNVPSIINGREYDPKKPEDFEAIIENAKSKMKQGWMFPNFGSLEEAEKQAGARSDSLMDARAEWRQQDLPETEDEWEEYIGKTAPKEDVKEDPWGLVIWDHATNTPAMFKRQYGGAKAFLNAPRDLVYIIEAAADQGVSPEDSFALEVEAYVRGKDPAVYYQELMDQLEENEDFHEGMRLHREATSYLRDFQPNVEEGSVKYYIGAILEGTINMAPALVASAVTRSPTVGAALIGGQVFADQYVESIEAGRSHSQAVTDGTIFAAAEILTERIPLGILTREGGTLLKRVLKSAGAEAIQEPLTQLIQEGYTTGIINEEMTLGEALVEILATEEGRAMLTRSAIIGAGVGGTLAGMAHPFYAGMTEEDVPEPPDLKKVIAKLPSEQASEISTEEAEEMGLEKVEVSLDLLERVAAGDPLTVDEQYTLTDGGYGRFINDGERVVMDPKGMKTLKELREGKSIEDEDARDGVPRRSVREEPPQPEITDVQEFEEIPAEERSFPRSKVTVPAFHGTDTAVALRPGVMHFSSDIEFSKKWGRENLVEAEINIENPEYYDDDGRHHEILDDPEEIEDLKRQGFDGVIIRNRMEDLPDNYVVFDAETQVKIRTPGAEVTEEIPEGTVTDEEGEPVIVWRGEHGLREDQDEEFQTRVGSLSFGSLATATVYAKDPNDKTKDRVAKDPRVQGYTIAINNPFINSKDDPFVDVSEIRRKLGPSAVRHVVENLGDRIMNTNNWEEHFAEEFDSPADVLAKAPERVDKLYLDLYAVLDDAEMVKRMKRKGYDGAIHQGMGENFDEIEYRIFDPAQAVRIPTVDVSEAAPDDEARPEIINKWSADSVEEQRQRLYTATHKAETSQHDPREQSDELLKAGTYEKGHIRFHGLPITIENPKGSVRRGKDDTTGRKWKSVLAHPYGYMKGVQGKDKDQIDVFIGPNPQSQQIYIVNQKANNDQTLTEANFDEHKVMLGFDSQTEAMAGYEANYPRGWKGIGSMSVMTMPQFKQWTGTPYTQVIAPETLVMTTEAHVDEAIGILHGRRMTSRIKYTREKDADQDPRKKQHIEPDGNYMKQQSWDAREEKPGVLYGTVRFRRPFIIPFNSKGANVENPYDQNHWTTVLSDQYDGLTGAALRDVLRDDGFDGVIAVNINVKSEPFEIVEMMSFQDIPATEASWEMTPLDVQEGGVRYKINEATMNFDAGVNASVSSTQAWTPGKARWEFTSPNVRMVETGTFKAGKKKITGTGKQAAEQVAHIVAPLRREAQESLMLLVADEKGNIKAVIRHAVAKTDSADIEPGIALGSIFATKGAKRVWMVHQHPSGTPDHSPNDMALFTTISESLGGTGIRVEASVVVTHGQGKGSWYIPEFRDTGSEQIDIPPLLRTKEVPIVERRFRKYGKPSKNEISEPKALEDFAKTLPEGEHMILMNTRHQVVGTVPIQNMKKLRTKNVGTGAGAVYRAVAQTNANRLMAVVEDMDAAINAMTFGEQSGIGMYDVAINMGGGTFLTLSDTNQFNDRNHKYKHKRPVTNMGLGVSVEKVQEVLRPIYRMFRTVPPVRVVESIEDLPKHLQASLETDEDRRNTTGIYDQGGFLDTVYIVANNVTDTQEAVETMLHEVVGHFGMHQILDPWDFNSIMDQVSESFEKEVRSIAKTYELDWNNMDERRIAAEEYIAHTAQRVLAGREVSSKARALLDAIVKAFKNFWLRVKGKPTLFTDGQIHSMIAEASTYVQTPGGYARDKQRGRRRYIRTPAYFSKLWNAFNDSDMKSGSAQSWKQFIQGQVKKGKFKDTEARWLRFTVENPKDPEQTTWFDDVTWNDIYRLSTSREWSSPTVEDELPQLEKFLPGDIVDKIRTHRSLGRRHTLLRGKADGLRQEAFDTEFPDMDRKIKDYNNTARAFRDQWFEEHPSEFYLTPNEQRDFAALDEHWKELGVELDTFGRTQPKKIPKDAVMSYIERNGVEISIQNPQGGDGEDGPQFESENYPDNQEEPDEDQWYDHWSEIQEGHWSNYYDDNLIAAYQEHSWEPEITSEDLDADELGISEEELEDMDVEALNEATGNWDGTSVDDMEDEARDRTTEEIEENYYSEERDEWVTKNTKREWYSGDFYIYTDSDGDFMVYHDGSELGYESNFDAAVQLAESHHMDEGSGTRWSSYVLDPKGDEYEEWLFRWGNPDNTIFQESGHWGDEDDNYVAHARFDVRKDKNGKAVIYIDEMQSDWAQEIRDTIKSKLEEVHEEHGYDPDFLNVDGTLGGGEDWDGTPVTDMLEQARRDAGADPERAKKFAKEAEALYDKLKAHKSRVVAELKQIQPSVDKELLDVMGELVQDAYAQDAREFLTRVTSVAERRAQRTSERLAKKTIDTAGEVFEKHGLYWGLNRTENLLFNAYRREVRTLPPIMEGVPYRSSLLMGSAHDDFQVKVIDRAKSEYGLTDEELNELDTKVALGDYEKMFETSKENVDGMTWQQAISKSGAAMSLDWETHPQDMTDYDGEVSFKELGEVAQDAAWVKLLDPDEVGSESELHENTLVHEDNHWQDAWREILQKVAEQAVGAENHNADDIFKMWVPMVDAMEKLSKALKNDKATISRKGIKPFEYEMDSKFRRQIQTNTLDFNEARNKSSRAKEGMVFPPFEKDWQLLVLKGMIHEAMRRGHDRIFISRGEVHGVRWSGAQTVESVVWDREVISNEDDKTIDMFTGKAGDKKQTAVVYHLTYPDAGRTDKVPASALRKTVGDRVANVIMKSKGQTGTVRAEDVELQSILIPTTSGGKRLTGSRKIYNELMPNIANKFLKGFKAKMQIGWVPGPGKAADQTEPERAGLAVKKGPSEAYDNWAKATVRPLTDKEMEATPFVGEEGPAAVEKTKRAVAERWLPPVGGRIIDADKGTERSGIPEWDGRVWGIILGDGKVATVAGAYRPWEADTWGYLEEQRKMMLEANWGYEAWEIEFTPELKEAMRTGFPLFHKRGGKKRTGDPGLDDALNWAEQNIGPQGPRSLERLQRTVFETIAIEAKQAKMEQAMLDQFAGLKWAIRQTHGHDLPAQVSAYKQAHFTTSQDSQMFVFLTHGIPYWEDVTSEGHTGTITQIKPGSKGLLEIMEPVADKIQFWGYWMAARRADRLLKEGREALFTQERVDELLKLSERFPEFQDVADAYNDWKTQFLDWAEGAGVINSETRPLWDQADYVPFYRIKSDEMGGSFAKNAGMGGPGIANVSQPIKRLLGSKHPLGDILENIIVNFQHIANTAMKNKAAQLTIQNLEGSGMVLPISGKEWMKEEFIPLDELKRKLKQAGVDWEAMDPEALAAMQKMWTLQRPEGEDVISVLFDGKKKYFRVKEETLLRSLTAINEKKFSSLLGRMGMWLPRKIKRLGTTMITLAPDFMAANWFRDLFMAFTNSRHANMPKPWSGVTGAWKAFTKSPEMVSMMAAGGAFYSGYINANDPVSTVKAMKRALRQTGLRNRILDAPWKLFHLYNDIGAASENANRIGSAYIPAIKAGAGKAEAVWESKDLMNFAKHGDHVLVQFFAQSVMFLNARVQGLTRYGQRFAEAPGITFAKSMMYAMAVLAIWLRNKDEDWYKALPEEEKDMYVHVQVNGKHWRLPKAFEVGMIFGVGIERMFEYFYSNEDDAGKVAIDRLWFVIGEVFNFFNRQTLVPLPQFIQPLFEASNNYNAFFQSPIVPEYMVEIAEVKPELAFRASTSPAMRELAKAMPGFAPDTLQNPMLLEHLVRGYFGTLGAYTMVMTDGLVRQAFDYPARPALRWSQIPVVKRFYRGDEPPSRTNFEEIMYEVRNNARQIERAVNQMERLEMDDEIDEFMEAGSKYDPTFTNQEVVEAAAAMEGSYEQIKQLRKETTELWEDEKMTPEEKLRDLNRIYREKMENAKDAYGERPGAAIQFEALQETLIDMDPMKRPSFLAEQGLDQTADLIANLPIKPDLRLRNIFWENSV